jgi:16S rRNA (guanine966-N2)-methyltransferase
VTRIVGGEFGGRRLAVPNDRRVRPTADRVREALFSIVAPLLDDARVLDLFAGSGALGLEALSRGAAHATLVEILPASLTAIRANVASLGVADRTTIRRADALKYLDKLEGLAFDVAFADPPYGHPAVTRVVERFRAAPFARTLVIEHDRSVPLAGDDSRAYGQTSLTLCYGS